ncbi:hypothetical protein ACUOFC_58885, partial [Escherichia sp. TWPC-MK]
RTTSAFPVLTAIASCWISYLLNIRLIDAAKMPKEAKEKAEAELQKLKMMSPMSAEATVVRGYIDWLIAVRTSTSCSRSSMVGDSRYSAF